MKANMVKTELGRQSFTWAGKPTSAAVGTIIRITDVGSTAAGTEWKWDGTRWNPNGRQRIFSSVADIELLEATSTSEQKAVGLLLPAGLIGAGYEIEATILHACSANANNKVLRVRLGAANDLTGTAFLVSSTAGASTATAQNQCKIRTTSASANAQIGHASSVSSPFSSSTGAVVTSAVDMSAASYLVISGQCAAGGVSHTIKAYTVDIWR